MAEISEKLEVLFDKWKDIQYKEIEEYENNRSIHNEKSYLKKYQRSKKLIKLDTRRSFTIDGIVDEKEWNKGKKILFILKEANIDYKLTDEKADGSVIADEGTFWFRNQIISDAVNRRRGIFRRLEKIGKDITQKHDFSLKSVAYMNINKRGGLSKSKEDIISAYFDKYKTQIIEEIKIINPSIVAICCGSTQYSVELSDIIKKELGIDVKLYYHPATRRVTDDEYLKGVQN